MANSDLCYVQPDPYECRDGCGCDSCVPHRCEVCSEPATVKSFDYLDRNNVWQVSKSPSYFCAECFAECERENGKPDEVAAGKAVLDAVNFPI